MQFLYKISYFIVSIVLCLPTFGADTTRFYDDRSSAPLGGVWVRGLPEHIKPLHHHLAMTLMQNEPRARLTTFANFALRVFKHGEQLPETIWLIPPDRMLRSAGYLVLTPDSDRYVRTELLKDEKVPVSQAPFCDNEVPFSDIRKNIEKQFYGCHDDSVEALNQVAPLGASLRKSRDHKADTQFSTDDALGKLHQASALIAQRQQLRFRYLKLNDWEEKVFPPEEYRAHAEEYEGYTSHIFDPEQMIARLVDHALQSTDDAININGRFFLRRDIKYITLDLHTRNDMCPFCLMFVAHKTKEWQSRLGVRFVTLVSSRQEYRSEVAFILDKPYYQSYSMRSMGWRSGDDGSTEDGILRIAAEGLVIQYAFQPWELFSAQTAATAATVAH